MTEATKFDTGKPNWSLMPFEALEEVVRVLEFGAIKYNEGSDAKADWNWAKKPGMKRSRLLSAACRHIFAYMSGQKIDTETGLNHMAHAACCVIFILYYDKHSNDYTN